jgi:hypothetical protein
LRTIGRSAGLQRVRQQFDPILAPEYPAVEHVFGFHPNRPDNPMQDRSSGGSSLFWPIIRQSRGDWPAPAKQHPPQQSVLEDALVKKRGKHVQDNEAGKECGQRGMRHEGRINRKVQFQNRQMFGDRRLRNAGVTGQHALCSPSRGSRSKIARRVGSARAEKSSVGAMGIKTHNPPVIN